MVHFSDPNCQWAKQFFMFGCLKRLPCPKALSGGGSLATLCLRGVSPWTRSFLCFQREQLPRFDEGFHKMLIGSLLVCDQHKRTKVLVGLPEANETKIPVVCKT